MKYGLNVFGQVIISVNPLLHIIGHYSVRMTKISILK